MATIKDLTETSLSQARTEIASMTTDRTVALHYGDTIAADSSTITWTAAGNDISTITDNNWVFDQGTVTVRFTDNDIIRTEEEPPKTYLQLPTGKRLISI